jgi:hypothetical protein
LEAGIGARAEPVCSDVATRRTLAERAVGCWIVDDENTDSSNGGCADLTAKAARASASGSRHSSSLPNVERCERVSTSKLEPRGCRLGYKLGCSASNAAKNVFACEQNPAWAPNRPGRSDPTSPAEYSFGDSEEPATITAFELTRRAFAAANDTDFDALIAVLRRRLRAGCRAVGTGYPCGPCCDTPFP